MPNNANVTALGNLIKDPEKNTTPKGTVLSFTIAVSTTLPKQDGSEGYEPNFYNVSIWGKPVEYLFPKLQKGTQVLAIGELIAQPYVNKKTGAAGQSLNIRASSVTPVTRLKPAPQRADAAAVESGADVLVF